MSVAPGYAGGTKPNPTYEDVCAGQSGHAEVIKIEFDPKIISYENLLEIFFATHDPTTPDQQGNDIGEQYRSIILTASEEQAAKAKDYLKKLTENKEFSQPIVTQIKPLGQFFPAENYHQNYYQNNQNKPYCQIVISPKISKFRKNHPELIQS